MIDLRINLRKIVLKEILELKSKEDTNGKKPIKVRAVTLCKNRQGDEGIFTGNGNQKTITYEKEKGQHNFNQCVTENFNRVKQDQKSYSSPH